MKYSDLTQSRVQFLEVDHSYTNADGLELSGVTSILKAVVFPDKYNVVDEATLRRKAEHGTKVHAACQLYDIMGIESDLPEVKAYKKIKADNAISMIAAEYLVSDESLVATMIDCVDDHGNLYDIKTTYSLDKEYLSWQLSVSAYLFDRQNESNKIKAGRLYGIWLKGERGELVEVERKTDKQIEELVRLFLDGRTLSSNIEDDVALLRVADLESQIIIFKEQVKALEEEKNRALSLLEENMKAQGLKKIETDRVVVSIVDDTTTKRFDSKLFEKEHPDLAKEYIKESVRKGYVRITIR